MEAPEISLLNEEQRRKAINEIIQVFLEEREEEIGIITAETFLDEFINIVGIDLYNKGVEDARKYLRNRFEDIAIDMESLLKDKPQK